MDNDTTAHPFDFFTETGPTAVEQLEIDRAAALDAPPPSRIRHSSHMKAGDLTWVERHQSSLFSPERAETLIEALNIAFPSFKYSAEVDEAFPDSVRITDGERLWLCDSAFGEDEELAGGRRPLAGYEVGVVQRMSNAFMDNINEAIYRNTAEAPWDICFTDERTAIRFTRRAYKLRARKNNDPVAAQKWRYVMLSRHGAVVTARVVESGAFVIGEPSTQDNFGINRATKQDIFELVRQTGRVMAFPMPTKDAAKRLLRSIQSTARYERKKFGLSQWDSVLMKVVDNKLHAWFQPVAEDIGPVPKGNVTTPGFAEVSNVTTPAKPALTERDLTW